MIRSQAIALQCAAALEDRSYYLRHGRQRRTQRKREAEARLGLSTGQSRNLTNPKLDQLEFCADDMARRLITGKSR